MGERRGYDYERALFRVMEWFFESGGDSRDVFDRIHRLTQLERSSFSLFLRLA